MFNYYGSKSKIVDYYPPPKYSKIIEPFAGSARYSLKWWDNEVTICDLNKDVIDVWKWLQACSKEDILGLPKLVKGLDIREINISEIERTFLSFLVASGRPSNIVTKFMDHYNHNQNRYKRIANQLERIRHWEILNCSYDDLENTEATWFIDPPYQFGGEYYKNGTKDIDFLELAIWCKERNGQSIVCENHKATWMPFKPMVKIQGASQTHTVEVIWSNIPTNYDNVQQSLFSQIQS
jgi:site-specific DNA-adenine methylase